MSTHEPQLGESNILVLIEQIRGLSPDQCEHRTIDFLAGFIMGKNMSIEAIQRMWGAAEIVHEIDPAEHMTMEEMKEVTFTLRTIASTLERR